MIEFIHPEDAAALEALKKIPVLPAVIKAFMDLGVEQLQTGLNMATKVRLSPTQLPHLYHILPPICELLDIKEPDFYLEMSPIPNAFIWADLRSSIIGTWWIWDFCEQLLRILRGKFGGFEIIAYLCNMKTKNLYMNIEELWTNILEVWRKS